MNWDDVLNEIYNEVYDLLDQIVKQQIANGGDATLWASEHETAHEALVELAARHGCEEKIQARLERDCNFTDAPKAEVEETLFYIVNREYCGDYAVFWKPLGQGYTASLRQAGLFTKEQCDQHRRNSALIFAPKAGLSLDTDTKAVVPFEIIKERFFNGSTTLPPNKQM